jgi:hypothetical protein
LWVKQLDKELDIEAISLDNIDTTSQWRVEIQEPEMEEAPEWLEEHANNLMEEGATEEEEEEEVPLPVDTEAEEEIGLPVDPMPPPPPQRAILRVGIGSVGTGRRQHTFPSTLVRGARWERAPKIPEHAPERGAPEIPGSILTRSRACSGILGARSHMRSLDAPARSALLGLGAGGGVLLATMLLYLY